MERKSDRELEEELNGKIAVTFFTFKRMPFIRLSDIRMKLVMVTSHGLSERACVGVLRGDGKDPFIRWTTDNHVWISSKPEFRGKLLVGKRSYYPESKYGILTSCPCVYPWKFCSSATISTLLANRAETDNLDTPEWFRCSTNFYTIKPRVNDPLTDAVLSVCPEYTEKEQWYTENGRKDGDPEIFEELPEERVEELREKAHKEYLEDLEARWNNLCPEDISVKEVYGFRVPFKLVRSGGIVLTPWEELERFEGRWQVLQIGTFRRICKDNKWTLYV